MFARTKRLTLRPAWPEDAPALAGAIGHEAVVMRLSRVPWPYTLDHARDFLGRPRAIDEPFFLILAHEEATPHLVGGIGLDAATGAHELGYWLTPSAWGRGYATEAGRAVVAMVRDALPIGRLWSRYHVDNPASGRVLGKLGFRSSGVIETVPSLAQRRLVDTALVELDPAGARSPIPIAA